ncbi:MAG: tol-pal system YbgF family protein [Candidatus Methylomirabilia bacterium]
MVAPGRSLREPSARWRWLLASAAVFLLALLAASGFWLWGSSYETRGLAELALATSRARQASAPEASPDLSHAAITALETVVDRYPRLSALPQAALQLGDLRFKVKEFAGAREAYQLAFDQASATTIRALARLGLGYAWEADRDYPNALAAFQAGLQGLAPHEFLYEELLLNVARLHALLGQRTQALETYRRFLTDRPQSPRAEEVRILLARLSGETPE